MFSLRESRINLRTSSIPHSIFCRFKVSIDATIRVSTSLCSIFLYFALTHSSDETNRNIPLSDIQNTSIELSESHLQQDEAQSSRNAISSDNLKIPHLGFNPILTQSN